ncbi:hypothetical protein ACLOJK_019865 [Asimina triloba]
MLKPSHPKLLRTSQMPSSRNLESVFNLVKRTFIAKSSPIPQSIYCLDFSNSRSFHSANPRLFRQSDPVLQHAKVQTVFDPLTNDLVTVTAADDGRDSGRAHENRSEEEPVAKKPTWSGQNVASRVETGIALIRKRSGKAKEKVNWVCQECGASEGQWWGSCPSCKAVGSLKEFREPVVGGSKIRRSWLAERPAEVGPKRLTEVNQGINQLQWRIPLILGCNMNHVMTVKTLSGLFGMEVSRVLGGGLVPGSLILVGGDPGVGKSTLLLQVVKGYYYTPNRMTRELGQFEDMIFNEHQSCMFLVKRSVCLRVYGCSHIHFLPAGLLDVDLFSHHHLSATTFPWQLLSHVSIEQIADRADRMRIGTDEIFLYSSTDIEDILEKTQGLSPRALIVDSIQTVYLRGLEGSAGNITQVKECTSALLRFAKRTKIPVLLIGHVTKTGEIAGPRVLEHIVDTVVYMEGEKHSSHRLLRSVKNRFGSTDECTSHVNSVTDVFNNLVD